MEDTIILRSKPELKIVFKSESFELTDVSEPNNKGIYLYENLRSVKLNPERTDWLVSITSWIADLFVGGGSIGGNYKNKANLQLEMTNRNLKIWLVNADFQRAERIVQFLAKKNLQTTKPKRNSDFKAK